MLLGGVRDARGAETLFAQLGGQPRLTATVDSLVEVMLADDRINFAFAQTDLSKFKRLLYAQLCELTGGPCTYRGRGMFEAHAKLEATNAQFNALAFNGPVAGSTGLESSNNYLTGCFSSVIDLSIQRVFVRGLRATA